MNTGSLNIWLLLAAVVSWTAAAGTNNLASNGTEELQTVATNLNGSGVKVAQIEAFDAGSSNWEVSPVAVGQPVSLFGYFSTLGNIAGYPNVLSGESGHADSVAHQFYGYPGGVATNVAHVDIFAADYFYGAVIAPDSAVDINDPVVNQSFTFGPLTASAQQRVDSIYDNYSVRYNTLFISAANNNGNSYPGSPRVCAPGTAYNCISVGAYQNGSSYNSVGPTIDNGRCKPDITAPAGETSFSAPQVAGAAVLLMQAGLRGDGGNDTHAATDLRVIKALLLNGAVKPADWTNSASSPLDCRYGAGVLNAFNSYEQLVGRKHGFTDTTIVPIGGAHPPGGSAATVGTWAGWDFNTNTSSATTDGVNHYYFNLTNDVPGAEFTATATLVWNREQNQTNINNLNLFLYNCASGGRVCCSTSLVDNVEHIFVSHLAPGRYDLQVGKSGGVGMVSAPEPYALAYDFVDPVPAQPVLGISASGNQIVLFWPNTATNYVLQSNTNLASLAWQTVSNLSPVTAGTDLTVTLNIVSPGYFYRLYNPNTSAAPPGMASIPAGLFTMGDLLDGESDASPTNIFVSGFYMDVNLVSYSQWTNVYFYATNQGYHFTHVGTGKAGDHPVQMVDWYDCVKWCNARSQQAGLLPVYYTDGAFSQIYTNGDSGTTVHANWAANGYRLPTEAEWEKAARGGLSGQRFPWGNTISEPLANYYGCGCGYLYDLAPEGFNPIGNYPATSPGTSPVGSFPANGFGLNDMAGNVYEWCWDWYGAYGQPTASNPTGPVSSMNGRVLRGGDWSDDAYSARCASRISTDPNFADYIAGFRCVRGL